MFSKTLPCLSGDNMRGVPLEILISSQHLWCVDEVSWWAHTFSVVVRCKVGREQAAQRHLLSHSPHYPTQPAIFIICRSVPHQPSSSSTLLITKQPNLHLPQIRHQRLCCPLNNSHLLRAVCPDPLWSLYFVPKLVVFNIALPNQPPSNHPGINRNESEKILLRFLFLLI